LNFNLQTQFNNFEALKLLILKRLKIWGKNIFLHLKGNFQPFELGSETRLIRSSVINWRPGKFILNLSHECHHKGFCKSDKIALAIEEKKDRHVLYSCDVILMWREKSVVRIRIRCLFDHGMGKKSGSGMNNPNYIFRELRNNILG
jgi:hypothetical protein